MVKQFLAHPFLRGKICPLKVFQNFFPDLHVSGNRSGHTRVGVFLAGFTQFFRSEVVLGAVKGKGCFQFEIIVLCRTGQLEMNVTFPVWDGEVFVNFHFIESVLHL